MDGIDHLGFEPIVLLFSLCCVGDSLRCRLRFQLASGEERDVTSVDLGFEISIRVKEIPIGVFDIRHQVSHGSRKFGQTDVRSYPGDEHTIDLTGLGSWTCNSVEASPYTLHQRLTNLGLDNLFPTRCADRFG